MTVHKLASLQQPNAGSENHNEFGEKALPFAPQISLSDGRTVIPQQYLDVRRTLASVESILSKISFASNYLLFAGRSGANVFLQVGIVGVENYPRRNQQLNDAKIVYGRRWLLEPTTPTSEVVQTALLAIKKAREHEVREKLFLKSATSGKVSTPFNSHQDLPLMASAAPMFAAAQSKSQISSETNLRLAIAATKFSELRLRLHKITKLGDANDIVEVDFLVGANEETLFPEMVDIRLAINCDSRSNNAFLHGLMASLIQASDRYVEENFEFAGFARFSHALDVEKIAEFSFLTRSIGTYDPRFEPYFANMSYQVDSAKAPDYAQGELGEQQRAALKANDVRAGYLPNDSTANTTRKKEPVLRTAYSS